MLCVYILNTPSDIVLITTRGVSTWGGGYVPLTLKSRGTSYVLVTPPTYTTQFSLIGWSPPIHKIVLESLLTKREGSVHQDGSTVVGASVHRP